MEFTKAKWAECTADKLFIVRACRLLTPPIHAAILESITRNHGDDSGSRAAYRRGEENDDPATDIFVAMSVFSTAMRAKG